MKRPTKEAYRVVAQKLLEKQDDFSMFEKAKVRVIKPEIEEGAWVECWLFIRDEEAREGKPDGN